MKAVFIDSHGSPEVLKYSDIDEPSCTPNKIKIQIKSSSINHLDLWIRKGIPGLHISLPRILGSDGAGRIVEVGRDVKNFWGKVGDDVVIQPGVYDPKCKQSILGNENLSSTYGILGETHDGVQSEFVILDPINIYKMPSHLSYSEISSMPLTFMTAYHMLFERAKVLKDDLVLVYGGSSGVGSAAIQILKNLGCQIISTVGSTDKINYVEDLGADSVFIHDSSLYSKTRDYLGKRKVDVVFEHIGKETWDTTIKILNTGGRVVTCGATTGADVKINLSHLFFKQQSILGSTMSNISSFNKVLQKISNKEYFPMIDTIFCASDIQRAHQRIENRKNLGKVVLDLS